MINISASAVARVSIVLEAEANITLATGGAEDKIGSSATWIRPAKNRNSRMIPAADGARPRAKNGPQIRDKAGFEFSNKSKYCQ